MSESMEIDEMPSKLRIDEVIPKDATFPLILNFQNGYPNDMITNTKCLLLKNKKTGLKSVATEIEGQLYAGDEEPEQLGHSFLLARNRVTGKVRIIEVGNVKVKPVFLSDKESNNEKATSLELSRKFGSKKSKKLMEQKEKLKVNVESVTEEMQKVAANTSVDQLDLKDYIKNDESEDFYVPPLNKDADRLDRVYPLEGIMPYETYDKIYSEIREKDFVSELTNEVNAFYKSRTLNPRETVLALYLSGMIKMYVMTLRVMLHTKFTISESSPTLHKVLMENFTQTLNGKISRPLTYKDKLLGHAMVVSMLLNNYMMDLDTFSQEVKTSIKTVMLKSKVTGAVVEKVKGVRMLRLKLPLASRTLFKKDRRKTAMF